MKRLYLSNDKKISGVCAGIAEYLDAVPTVIRLGWVVMTLVTGIVPGVIAYVISAIVMPTPPTSLEEK